MQGPAATSTGIGYGGHSFSSNLDIDLAAGSGFFVDGINTIELRGHSVNNVRDAFWISTTAAGEVTAVPEPGSRAMLLAGPGLTGSVASRRRA